jgi:uncharacterized protein YfiM (DUF2279 family)
MTSARMAELALRRHMLQQRSAVLRHTLAIQVNSGLAPLSSKVDRALAAGRWLWQHPVWLVAGAVALAVWQPQGLSRLAGRGLLVWRAWQRWQPVLQPLFKPLQRTEPAEKQ